MIAPRPAPARPAALALLLAALAALAAAPPAGAQVLAPSLLLDRAYAGGDGVARDDLNGTLTDIPGGVAVDGDRIIVAGETRNGSGDIDVALVVRRAGGALDTTFSGDGRLALPIADAGGRDAGHGVVALPDGRLRVLVATDSAPGAGVDQDLGVVGLQRDGSLDPAFGGGDGLVVLKPGSAADTPKRLTLGPDGRLALTGARTGADGKEDSVVGLLEADGTPAGGFGTGGLVILDRAGAGLNDSAADVAFRPGGGLVALLQVETDPDPSRNGFVSVLRALDAAGGPDPAFSGDGDLVLEVGEPDTTPGGLVVRGDALWVSGQTRAGAETDAFVARVRADGSGLESRRFDVRTSSADAVSTNASDLALMPGRPDVLVASGSVSAGSRPAWAAAAFSGLDGPVADLPSTDLIIPTEELGAVVGVAAGDGFVALTGSLVDTQQNFDTTIGTARVLVDSEKRCDLGVEVERPLEAQMTPGGATAMTARVTNAGTRPCGGVLAVDAPFVLRGATVVPVLAPGAGHVAALELADAGTRRRDGIASVAVRAAGDANAANDVARLRVGFRFCAPGLQASLGRALLPTEGPLRLAVTVRNGGTISCAGLRLTGGGRAQLASGSPITLAAGRSATELVAVRAPARVRDGAKVSLVLGARAQEPLVAPEPVRRTLTVAAVGDSAIRRAGARAFGGRARPGSRRLGRRSRRVARVEVAAFRRSGRRCRWLTSASGATRTGPCASARWVRARGRSSWSLRLARALPDGRWTVRSRAVLANGFTEGRWSAADGNQRRLRLP